jgi:selenocysteine lyase/cysteine desulfurase
MNIRDASFEFHQKGIFINSIEYPAVPKSQQRFRISIMATHTKEDIDRLMEAITEIWRNNEPEQEKKTEAVKVYFNNKKVLFN